VILVLCKGLSGACSAFGFTIMMFFKNKSISEGSPTWSTMAERLTTMIGLLGLLMVGRTVSLICVMLGFIFMYINQRPQLKKEEAEEDAFKKEIKSQICFRPNGELMPEELLVLIFSFLPAPQLGQGSVVCRYWNRLSQEGSLWRRLYEDLDSKPFSVQSGASHDQWREIFKQNCLCPSTVSLHNKVDDAWIIIGKKVYNITNFMESHPGGEDLLMQFAGKDATSAFKEIDHTDIALKYRKDLQVGTLQWGGSLKSHSQTHKKSNGGSTIGSMCSTLDMIRPFTILVAFVALNLCEYLYV